MNVSFNLDIKHHKGLLAISIFFPKCKCYMFRYTYSEPPHWKTNNLHMRKQRRITAKLISAFVFATQIVHFLSYLNSKFQASSSFLCLYRPVYVGPVRKPHSWFFHEAQLEDTILDTDPAVASFSVLFFQNFMYSL